MTKNILKLSELEEKILTFQLVLALCDKFKEDSVVLFSALFSIFLIFYNLKTLKDLSSHHKGKPSIVNQDPISH